MDANNAQLPWYRHPWVWLLIALPSVAVIVGFILLYLAITTNDGLVVDDYYQQGLAINQVLARDRAAAEHGLEAHITLDIVNNRVNVQLTSRDALLPETLTLSFLHPTIPGHDQQIRLTRIGDDRYRGHFDDLRNGHWDVQLETGVWRLFGRIRLPLETPAILRPLDNLSP